MKRYNTKLICGLMLIVFMTTSCTTLNTFSESQNIKIDQRKALRLAAASITIVQLAKPDLENMTEQEIHEYKIKRSIFISTIYKVIIDFMLTYDSGMTTEERIESAKTAAYKYLMDNYNFNPDVYFDQMIEDYTSEALDVLFNKLFNELGM